METTGGREYLSHMKMSLSHWMKDLVSWLKQFTKLCGRLSFRGLHDQKRVQNGTRTWPLACSVLVFSSAQLGKKASPGGSGRVSQYLLGWVYLELTNIAWLQTLIYGVAQSLLTILTTLRFLITAFIAVQSPPGSQQAIQQLRKLKVAHDNLNAGIIPWVLVYPFFAFFPARSSLLNYLNDSNQPKGVTRLQFATVAFGLSLVMCLTEGLTPDRMASSKHQPNFEAGSSLFSRLTFSYMNSFISKMNKSNLINTFSLEHNIPLLKFDYTAAKNVLEFRRTVGSLNQESKTAASLVFSLVWHFRWEILLQEMFATLRAASVVVPPLLMGKLLQDMGKEHVPLHVLLLYCGGIFFFQQFSTIAIGQASYIGSKLLVRIQATLMAEIFSKVQTRKLRSETSQGQIISLMSSEVGLVANSVGFLWVRYQVVTPFPVY